MSQVAATTGEWPEDWLPLDPPEECGFVWDVYWELRRTAKGGFGGPEPLGFADLAAWQNVRGIRLGNGIADMIFAMDRAYLGEVSRMAAKAGRK